MHIGDITTWARTRGIEIVLFVVGAVLIGRLIHWVGGRYVRRLDLRARRVAELGLATDDSTRQLHTLAQVAEWLCIGVLYVITFLLVVSKFQLPLTSLVVPATAVGAAIGFGAQRVVQDLLAGFFIFAEKQYGFGDVVQLSAVGETAGISGTIEEVTLRTTRLRTVRGELVIVPNGAFQQVINRSRDWSRVIIDVPVPMDQDLGVATDVLRSQAAALAADEEWSALLLDEPAVVGVESLQAGYLQLRVTARTLPNRQIEVARELRRRIAEGLKEAGIMSTAALS
jgi:small conductance mechanosensitive channel